MSTTRTVATTRSASRNGARADGAPPNTRAPSSAGAQPASTRTTTNPRNKKTKANGPRDQQPRAPSVAASDVPHMEEVTVPSTGAEDGRRTPTTEPERTRTEENASDAGTGGIETTPIAESSSIPPRSEAAPTPTPSVELVQALHSFHDRATAVQSNILALRNKIQRDIEGYCDALDDTFKMSRDELDIQVMFIAELASKAIGVDDKSGEWNEVLEDIKATVDQRRAATTEDAGNSTIRQIVPELPEHHESRRAMYPNIEYRHGKSPEVRLYEGGLDPNRQRRQSFQRAGEPSGHARGADDPFPGSDPGSDGEGDGGPPRGPPGGGPPGRGPPGGGPPSSDDGAPASRDSSEEGEVEDQLRQSSEVPRHQGPARHPRFRNSGNANFPVSSISGAIPSIGNRRNAHRGNGPSAFLSARLPDRTIDPYIESGCNWLAIYIKKILGTAIPKDTPRSKNKPNPPDAYEGQNDQELFDEWSRDHIRYLRLSGLCGMDGNVDEERIFCMGNNLKKEALRWYRDEVELHLEDWTFTTAMCALYARFVRAGTSRTAAKKYDSVRYQADGGVNSLYNRLL